MNFSRGELLRFSGLERGARVVIYSLAGAEVATLGPATSRTLAWDGRNRDGRLVAAGIFLYGIDTPVAGGAHAWRKGKFGVIR